MKIAEIKHNHSLTDLLKIILFTILMMLPFLSVASRCLYVICNKNAKDSYYGATINQTQTSVVNTLRNNTIYYINYTYDETTNRFNGVTLFVTQFNEVSNTFNINDNDVDRIVISNNGTNNYPRYRLYQGSTLLVDKTTANGVIDFSFLLISYNDSNLSDFLNTGKVYTITYNDYSYLDNAFEYSVNKLQDNNLFNWTENTGVYTGVKAMTDNLQINMPVIPMIVTYWFLLTVIYIIIDLIVKAFTTLTHMFIKKTT